MSTTSSLDAAVEALCGDLSAIRAPRGHGAERALVGDRGAAADAAQQPRPRGRRAAGGAVVYGGSGKAARSHEALQAIVRSLLRLGDDETLLVQSGKPVGVFRTHAAAPRVLIANSLLVPRWATWDEFRRLEALGLTMFGQMTAGSWIYIGTQGILQGTYQTFAAAGEKHFGSADLRGRTILTAGLGGMGGAQPLAATMAGAAILCVEVDPVADRAPARDALSRRGGRLARRRADAGCGRRRGSGGRCRSALLGNAAEVVPGARRRAASTSTSSPTRRPRTIRSTATCPSGLGVEEASALRESDPEEYLRRASASIARHVEALLEYVRAGSYVFDYGNNLQRRGR